MKRVRVIVDGKVQGIGFRYYVAHGASQYNIKGYVKNIVDGKVEIDAEGECDNIHLFLESCKKGPEYSQIDTFIVRHVPMFGFQNFRIK